MFYEVPSGRNKKRSPLVLRPRDVAVRRALLADCADGLSGPEQLLRRPGSRETKIGERGRNFCRGRGVGRFFEKTESGRTVPDSEGSDPALFAGQTRK